MLTRPLQRVFLFPALLPALLAALALGARPLLAAPPGEACSASQWLAMAVDPPRPGVCPQASGWSARPLFGPDSPIRPLFCRYDRVPCPDGGYGGKACPADLRKVRGLSAAVPACGVVAPLAAASPDILSSELLYRELRFQVGATDLPLTPQQSQGVRVAVVDTQPDGTGVPAAPGQGSPHGFDLALLVHDLTCSAGGCAGDAASPAVPVKPGTAGSYRTGACAALVTTRLALPLITPSGAPSTTGGFFGRPSDLAVAIANEIHDWVGSGKALHLIVNLSVGWDHELLHNTLHAEDASHLNAEELAVYAALAYARAEGALPIAAAGNSPGGSQPGRGATDPARWYAGPPSGMGSSTSAQDPVVFAVGAVARDDQPLANVRSVSLPPYAAYGDHAVAPLPAGGWTNPLTGSSVSAAVASAIAAVAWNLRPELTADQVMALLMSSGRTLPRTADLHRPLSSLQAAPAIRRLWFHDALSWAWSQQGLYSGESSFSALTTVSCPSTHTVICGGRTFVVCATSGQGCPSSLPSVGSVPWNLPQPGSDPCPTCSISSGPPSGINGRIKPNGGGVSTAGNRLAALTAGQWSGTLAASSNGSWTIDLKIASDWGGGCLTDPVVEVASPGVSYNLLIPLAGPLCAGDSLIVTDLTDMTSFDPQQGTAAVTFTLPGGTNSVRSPLYVNWQQ